MNDGSPNLSVATARSHWIRLRTMVVLRWVAIIGQIGAIETGRHVYGLQLDLVLCYAAIGAAVLINLATALIYPENRRLSENETLLTLLFDLLQLALLLYLTGGLNNPFALLILVPVTIAATALRRKSTLILGGLAIALVTGLGLVFMPLRLEAGTVIEMPDLLRFGFWAAIVIGVAFMALYARRVATEINSMADALLATQLALAREQKLTDLGGVVAAAAHELGTPLATIKLVSSELVEELEGDEILRADALLISEQADRCRDILRSMGRAGKDDLLMRHAPLDSVVREAAEPHRERGKTIRFDVAPDEGGSMHQPSIQRRPEIIHGLRNLVQNAVDFSERQVWIEARWNERQVKIRIIDDGTGFPPNVLGRIGDPFMRARRSASAGSQRPEYEGMGLGLFIAKTLLERTGASLSFSNGTDPFLTDAEHTDRSGAIVEVVWPAGMVTETRKPDSAGLGENAPIQG